MARSKSGWNDANFRNDFFTKSMKSKRFNEFIGKVYEQMVKDAAEEKESNDKEEKRRSKKKDEKK